MSLGGHTLLGNEVLANEILDSMGPCPTSTHIPLLAPLQPMVTSSMQLPVDVAGKWSARYHLASRPLNRMYRSVPWNKEEGRESGELPTDPNV